jgi:hypothetical protein
MELLERYLQAVGKHLPAKGREDMLAELRANLLAEIEEREETAGRPLNEDEIAAVLEAHGMPVVVAARYLPQRSLIGPAMFPFYWYTLKKSFPLVVLAYAAVQGARILIEGKPLSIIPEAIWHFWSVALTFWAITTIGFASFEYLQQNYGAKAQPKWSVRDLPKLEPEEKRPSLVNGVADLVVSILMVAWMLAVPAHPYLIIGPGVHLAQQSPFSLTPEWRSFYWPIIGLLVAMWPLKIMMMMPRFARIRQSLDVAVHILGILVVLVIVLARSYFVPAGALTVENMKTLAGINTGINLGFKVVLLIMLLKLASMIWQVLRGSPQRKAGCAVVF